MPRSLLQIQIDKSYFSIGDLASVSDIPPAIVKSYYNGTAIPDAQTTRLLLQKLGHNFATSLNDLMTKYNLSNSLVGRALGISSGTVERYRDGAAQPVSIIQHGILHTVAQLGREKN